jgi:hypothetical protein
VEKLPQASESWEAVMEFVCRCNVENCVKSATKEKESIEQFILTFSTHVIFGILYILEPDMTSGNVGFICTSRIVFSVYDT